MNTETNIGLDTLQAKLEHQLKLKQDFIVPAETISFSDARLMMRLSDEPEMLVLNPNDNFHAQLASKLEIPTAYYKRMQEQHTPLLDYNVNSWLRIKKKQNYFLRTFKPDGEQEHGTARAFLSDRYRVIDNTDVLYAALEAIYDISKQTQLRINVESSSLTDKKMYVRVTSPDIEIQAPKLLERYRVPGKHHFPENPHGIISGFVLSNSEVGHGTFTIAPRAKILVCQNGLINDNESFKKVHLGGRLDSEESVIVWSRETQQQNIKLIISQVRDAVKTFLSKDFLGAWIEQIEGMGSKKLLHPIDAVQNVAAHYSISETRKKAIMDFFVESGDVSGFGISQALTFQAHEDSDADAAYELETIASTILPNLSKFDRPYRTKKAAKEDLN